MFNVIPIARQPCVHNNKVTPRSASDNDGTNDISISLGVVHWYANRSRRRETRSPSTTTTTTQVAPHIFVGYHLCRRQFIAVVVVGFVHFYTPFARIVRRRYILYTAGERIEITTIQQQQYNNNITASKKNNTDKSKRIDAARRRRVDSIDCAVEDSGASLLTRRVPPTDATESVIDLSGGATRNPKTDSDLS